MNFISLLLSIIQAQSAELAKLDLCIENLENDLDFMERELDKPF